MQQVQIVISCLLLAFLAFALFIFVPLVLTYVDFFHGVTNSMVAMVEKSFSMVVMFLFCVAVTIFIKDKNFHFLQQRFFFTLAVGFLGFLGITLFVFMWESFTQDSSSVALIKQMGIGESFWDDLWLIFAIVLFGPIVEELTFRWLIYSLVKKAFSTFISLKISIIIAMVISSWAFMVIHGANEQISQHFALFIVGLILALIYEISGSIVVPIIAHCLNNALALYQNITQAHISFASNWLLLAVILLPFVSFLIIFIMQKFFYLLCPKPTSYM